MKYETFNTFLCPRDEESEGILIYPCPSVCPSGYRYMVCPAISSYSFGATALIFCRIFIHIMEVCIDENQNPMDMHTSIMCINILQNIKAVALQL
jgi:hypothetical protein